jgi:hypothetical protein
MNTVSNNTNPNIDASVLSIAEKEHSIAIQDDIKQFIISNAGGYPRKNVIHSGDEEYEVRVFLSLDRNDPHYFIGDWLNDFLTRTNGKIIPIAIDSENNIFCVNNETGKVYYWSYDSDEYFCISSDLSSFINLF